MVEEIEHTNTFLVRVFIGLTGLILILTAVIVMMNFPFGINDNKNENEQELMLVSGFELDVNDRLSNDPNYTTDDVIETYENELKKGDIHHKLEVATSYAYFLNNRLGFTEKAISVIEPLGPMIEEKNDLINYYSALSDLYRILGDDEKSDSYSKKMDEVIAETISDSKENEKP